MKIDGRNDCHMIKFPSKLLVASNMHFEVEMKTFELRMQSSIAIERVRNNSKECNWMGEKKTKTNN